MSTQRAPQRGSQGGIGLIEVMIALTIGLVLLIGVGQYFLSMRQTAASAQNMSAVQNQQRMAMYFLHTAVSGAGFNPDPLNNAGDIQYPATGVFTFAGQTLVGALVGASDTLTVRFTATTGGAEQGCSATLTAGHRYTDVFSVTADGFLACAETDNDATPVATTTVKLISGLTGMNILYGVDASGSGSASQYLTAAQVAAATFWGNVITVQATLVFANPLAGQPMQPATVQLMETIPYMANI